MQDLSKQPGTWKWGILCLVFLAPFFFWTYGFANQYAAQLSNVPSIVYNWEKHIPLWPWTIVPYWSIDLFYGLSLVLCWNKFELKQHVSRLICAQVISISCFLLFPLKFTFERPELSGFFGIWFDILMGFDKPFNQAPSLHIVLLIILWDFYRRHTDGIIKVFVDFWSFLIGLSVITTWQHHFIDIPTGILVGGFCLWLFPIQTKSVFKKDELQKLTPKHLKFGVYYLLGSIFFAALAFILNGVFVWLAYPALSLFLVSLAYFLVRPHFFQKLPTGKMSNGAWILFAPYFIFAWLNSRIWTRSHPEDSLIIEVDTTRIYLGRIPNAKVAQQYHSLFDCCAELPLTKYSNNNQRYKPQYQSFKSLDLIPLQANQLQSAVEKFDLLFQQTHELKDKGQSLLIFCALGYSRSTSILCAWLIKNNHAHSAQDAMTMIQNARPWIVLKEEQIKQINLYVLKLKGLAP